MKRIEVFLQTAMSAGVYLAPQIRIVNITPRRMICQSKLDVGFSSMEEKEEEGWD